MLIVLSLLTKYQYGNIMAMHFVVSLVLVMISTTSASPTSVTSAPRVSRTLPTSRLTTVEWESYHEREHAGPGSYAFGYDVQDEATGNVQFREESRDADGTVRGSYGLLEPDGNVRIVHYIADKRGFRVEIENSLKPDEQHPSPRRTSAVSLLRRPFLTSRPQFRPLDVTTFRYPYNLI